MFFLNFGANVHKLCNLQAVVYILNTGKITVWPNPTKPILDYEFST